MQLERPGVRGLRQQSTRSGLARTGLGLRGASHGPGEKLTPGRRWHPRHPAAAGHRLRPAPIAQPVAAPGHAQDLRVMEEPVQIGVGRRPIVEQLAPFLNGPVGGRERLLGGSS